ncbi:pentapeptide repeat-containing protein [Clostridium sp. YIM B02505]|uniref:Pentapeptide repeat-containing protein n=1 Tax=Clostridium yunnanense TaxID=2800325 RepID=A0ABS1EWX7_9CLOT|nr:pentapeptide repeat-containing protein [Clostridium yunnanense]MBK1813824.1 pentapeptide repeat-containing protein [Clostridium yunnanense]
MIYIDQDKFNKELKAECKDCFGLCCIALYFSASDGFPTNKDAGKPCINLKEDFTCSVHNNLINKGLKGCTAYECFGAGQKIAQVTYEGKNWRQVPEASKEMFEAFLIMRQLHEMLWYLTEAYNINKESQIKHEIGLLINKTEEITLLDAKELLKLDVEAHRNKVNMFLRNVSEMVRNNAKNKENLNNKKKRASGRRYDYFGADMRKMELVGADLRGACLIAANLKGTDLSGADLIGADLRDADLCGSNLIDAIFLSQAQINAAKGDINTKLPLRLVRPSHWMK